MTQNKNKNKNQIKPPNQPPNQSTKNDCEDFCPELACIISAHVSLVKGGYMVSVKGVKQLIPHMVIYCNLFLWGKNS
jgi:hypothetical protein